LTISFAVSSLLFLLIKSLSKLAAKLPFLYYVAIFPVAAIRLLWVKFCANRISLAWSNINPAFVGCWLLVVQKYPFFHIILLSLSLLMIILFFSIYFCNYIYFLLPPII